MVLPVVISMLLTVNVDAEMYKTCTTWKVRPPTEKIASYEMQVTTHCFKKIDVARATCSFIWIFVEHSPGEELGGLFLFTPWLKLHGSP